MMEIILTSDVSAFWTFVWDKLPAFTSNSWEHRMWHFLIAALLHSISVQPGFPRILDDN